MSNKMEQEISERQIEDLVQQAQEGDRGAFGQLVRVFEKPMFNLAYRMTGNREDAADMTQEIFVKAYRSIKKFHGRSKFSTWLYAVGANTCRSGLRKRIRISSREVMSLDAEKETDDGTLRHEATDPGDLPDKQLERQEVMARIQEVVASLPEDFRLVIVLRDIQGLAYEEVAETLDCSVGTVKSRLSRARNRVKDRLIREGLTCAVKA